VREGEIVEVKVWSFLLLFLSPQNTTRRITQKILNVRIRENYEPQRIFGSDPKPGFRNEKPRKSLSEEFCTISIWVS